jgi:DNA-binding transcriptional LysR family regulator
VKSVKIGNLLLNVTPAAVGQPVRRLEEILGVESFHRSQAGPARLLLTEAAQAALPGLRAGFEHLSAAINHLRSAQTRRTLNSRYRWHLLINGCFPVSKPFAATVRDVNCG